MVAVVAILQALLLFHVPALLAKFYAPYGDTEALYLNRGGSTLATPLAVADVMVITLAVTVGFGVFGRDDDREGGRVDLGSNDVERVPHRR